MRRKRMIEQMPEAKDGGIIKMKDGGLTKYEISSLKGLGYDTKGGTVLEPFGGLKVLRDILKVNKMADGGIMKAKPQFASAILGDESDDISMQLFGKPVKDLTPDEFKELQEEIDRLMNKFRGAKGGIASMAEGGMMDMGGMEMDLRGGGFVPMGKAEKADDVPARLSKNEFVFTADAVRAAGGGNIDKGADKMYATMKALENKVA